MFYLILKGVLLKLPERRTGETENRRMEESKNRMRIVLSQVVRRFSVLPVFRLSVVLALTSTAGCRQDMHDQPKYEALEASDFFPDGRAARQLVPGTVARGQLKEDAHLYEGKVNGKPAETFPFPVTLQVLQRGQERYNIYCTPCHDRVGTGEGMVVRRGFRRPSSYHIDRLRQAPPGYFFDVITNGFGAMQDYSAQIPVRDRWAIVAFVRALQLSQNAALTDVPESEKQSLQAGAPK
jgi:Cytochrome C oxidase, cbb3-type, subunit III